MNFHERLLLENQAWAYEMQNRDPDYFSRLGSGQSPEAFWIGCSDSRVPAEHMTNASPGDLFVHRNVANVAAIDDPTFMSALEYSVSALGVRYIVVCGHENCGGIGAACSGHPTGLEQVDNHLAPVVAHHDSLADEFASIDDATARVNAMVRHHVIAQVERLAAIPLIRQMTNPPTLLGLVYTHDSGVLETVCEYPQATQAEAAAA
ncbi:carbonic anhydrase [Salinisphaera sp. SPP-AMP-43]|uniref:carbonic anhydrase n=1 Tax=Salinisphaera sp. SPP-AMP-43 TaxID=3121288 RepID=UPI003C6E1C54